MNNIDEAVAFLNKCLDKDEAVIKQAAAWGSRWRIDYSYGGGPQDIIVDKDYGDSFFRDQITMDGEGVFPSVADNAAEHIATFDPERMLAEIEAKRATLEALDPMTYGAECHEGVYSAAEYIVALMLEPYKEYEGYKPRW